MKRISVIVPVFNEEETIEIYYNEIYKHLPNTYDWTLLFVNDGSSDQTQAILNDLSKKDQKVKYIKFSRNFGKEGAMLAGLEYSYHHDYDAVIIMDVDLQDPPELIRDMVSYYEQGYKHIYAKHRSRANEPFLRRFFAMNFYRVYSRLTGDVHVVRGARDYSLLDKDVVKAFIDVNDYTRFTKGIFSWVGFDKKCIEFDYVKRSAGKTKWSFWKLLKYAMRGINQFSHFYKILPTLLIILFAGMIVFDVFYLDLSDPLHVKTIAIEGMLLLMTLVMRTHISLSYDIRDHGLHRPKYIVEETNMRVNNETVNR